MCPVCHEPLGPELVILPCGHQLCCKCSISLVDRQSHVPQVNHSAALISHQHVVCKETLVSSQVSVCNLSHADLGCYVPAGSVIE